MGITDPSFLNLKKASRDLLKAKRHVLQAGRSDIADCIQTVYTDVVTLWVTTSHTAHQSIPHNQTQSVKGCAYCSEPEKHGPLSEPLG